MQVPLCRHIKANGTPCDGVALKDHLYCYWHRKLTEGHAIYRNTVVASKSLLDRGHILALPAIEDRASCQLAISEIVNALACNFIDSRRANALLFGLKLAVHNCRGLDVVDQPTKVVRECRRAPDLLDSVSVDIAPPGRSCELPDPPPAASLPDDFPPPPPDLAPAPPPREQPWQVADRTWPAYNEAEDDGSDIPRKVAILPSCFAPKPSAPPSPVSEAAPPAPPQNPSQDPAPDPPQDPPIPPTPPIEVLRKLFPYRDDFTPEDLAEEYALTIFPSGHLSGIVPPL